MTLYFRDISGQRFGSLLALWPVTLRDAAKFAFQCDCGTVKVLLAHSAISGNTKSCGCKQHPSKHGMKHAPEYSAYLAAKGRCTNPKSSVWKYYGGRGVQFKFSSFQEFIDHIGLRPQVKGYSLDRINNSGHYELGNVRWATRSEQRCNSRRFKRVRP